MLGIINTNYNNKSLLKYKYMQYRASKNPCLSTLTCVISQKSLNDWHNMIDIIKIKNTGITNIIANNTRKDSDPIIDKDNVDS